MIDSFKHFIKNKKKFEVKDLDNTVNNTILEKLKSSEYSQQAEKINKYISNKFQDIEKTFDNVLNSDASFFQRVVSQQETAGKIVEAVKECASQLIKTSNGADIVSNITRQAEGLVQNILQGPVAELLKQAGPQEIAKELGLNNATRINLQRTTLQQQNIAL
jgi:GTP1/Obg family GTP-binding protein